MAWIDKFIKFSYDISLIHLRSCNLNQVIIDCWKSCRFHVKDHVSCFRKIHLHFVIDDRDTVFYDIGFHPIDQLDTSLFSCLIAMREGLNIPVVRDCYRLMSPFCSFRHEFFDFRESIHGGHIGMSVKFDPSFSLWHQILTFVMNNFLHILDIHR